MVKPSRDLTGLKHTKENYPLMRRRNLDGEYPRSLAERKKKIVREYVVEGYVVQVIRSKDQEFKVLRSPYVVVDIDVDFDLHQSETSVTFPNKNSALYHLTGVLETLDMDWVMYETVGGYRVICDSLASPKNPDVDDLFNFLRGDFVYLGLCKNVGHFPIRVSPKPGRKDAYVAQLCANKFVDGDPSFIHFTSLHWDLCNENVDS
jgi:hypothetical protein